MRCKDSSKRWPFAISTFHSVIVKLGGRLILTWNWKTIISILALIFAFWDILSWKKSLWLNRNFRAQGISVSSLRFVVSEVLFHVQGLFKMQTFFSLAIRISAFATDDISITRYNCRLTWTNLKILPKFGDQHSIYLGFLRWLNWSVLKNLWKISIVIFSKPLRCVQRKPSTAEVLNFTKRPGEKVLTIYHRKSLFKDKSSNISSTSSKSSSFE